MAGQHSDHGDERQAHDERQEAHDEFGRAGRLDDDEERGQAEDQDRDAECAAKETGVRQPTPRSSAARRRSRWAT